MTRPIIPRTAPLRSGIALLVLAIVTHADVFAQTRPLPADTFAIVENGPTTCSALEAHRFDFWAGDWSVESRRRDSTGEWRETRNQWRAETVLGGCTFVDFADGDFGTGAMRGMGTRYYDAQRDRWFITSLSTENPGELGLWEGGFDEAGVGDFFMDIETPTGTLRSRIRWWDVTADGAEWEHAISRDQGATWTPTWRMTFRRK